MTSNERAPAPKACVLRKWAGPIAIAVLVFVVGVTSQPIGGAEGGAASTAMQLVGGLAREIVRVTSYLAYYDQVQRMEVAQGRLSAADADARLRRRAHEFYSRSYTESDLGQLLAQHRQSAQRYFASVEQELLASQRLPADWYRAEGRARLEQVRREYEQYLAQRLDPLFPLEGAATVHAWAKGSPTLEPHLNPFAGQRDRIAAAVPDGDVRNLIMTVPRLDADAPATAGGRPIPGEMGRSTPPPSAPPVGSALSPPQSGEDEHVFWRRVYAANTREGYESYLRLFPQGQYVDIARAALGIQTPTVATAPVGRPIPGEMGRPTTTPGTTGPGSVSPPTPPPTGGIAAIPPPQTTLPPPDAEVARGYALFNQGQYREALAAFDSALRAYSKSVDALLGRGRSLNALGDLAGAIQAYETALQLDPRRPNVRSWIAELAMASNDFQRAEAALAEELRLVPSSGWAHSFVGTLRMLQGRQPEAHQAMATAMRLDPAVATQRYNNATFLGGVGQSRRALVEFSSVLILDPNMTSAYYGMGVESARLGQTAQAVQAYEAYLQHDSTSEWAQRARQELMRLRGQMAVPNPTDLPPGATLSCPPDSIPTAAGCVWMHSR